VGAVRNGRSIRGDLHGLEAREPSGHGCGYCTEDKIDFPFVALPARHACLCVWSSPQCTIPPVTEWQNSMRKYLRPKRYSGDHQCLGQEKMFFNSRFAFPPLLCQRATNSIPTLPPPPRARISLKRPNIPDTRQRLSPAMQSNAKRKSSITKPCVLWATRCRDAHHPYYCLALSPLGRPRTNA